MLRAIAGPALMHYAARNAFSQSIPKLAQLLVGFPAGGTTEVVARLIAEQLQGVYADTVIVDNKPGAGGRIAIENLTRKNTARDTLLLTPDFPLTLSLAERKLTYDLFRKLDHLLVEYSGSGH